MVRDQALLRVLEKAAASCGVIVRRDKGNFQSGRCVVDGRQVIFLNRNHPTEAQLRVLALALHAEPIDVAPLRPKMREAVLQLMDWTQQELR